jgi:hypothetical protein
MEVGLLAALATGCEQDAHLVAVACATAPGVIDSPA